MLEREFKYFKDNRDELTKLYAGKYIVIRGNEVVGIYDSDIVAYTASKEKYELGTFLIQRCVPGENDLRQTFQSRVHFPPSAPSV